MCAYCCYTDYTLKTVFKGGVALRWKYVLSLENRKRKKKKKRMIVSEENKQTKKKRKRK